MDAFTPVIGEVVKAQFAREGIIPSPVSLAAAESTIVPCVQAGMLESKVRAKRMELERISLANSRVQPVGGIWLVLGFGLAFVTGYAILRKIGK